MESSETPWYADGLRFECTRCGQCCRGAGYVWVDEAQIGELAEYLGLSREELGRRYLRRVGNRISLTEKAGGDCVFWQAEKGCTVYPARPRQCRTFPFWPEYLESAAAWRELASRVPGIGRGRRHEPPEIRRRLRREWPRR